MLDHMVKGDSTGSLDVVVDRHRRNGKNPDPDIHPSIYPPIIYRYEYENSNEYFYENSYEYSYQK